MQNKKSKAFIITFIIVILLLVGGYFLFKNSDKIFGVKGSTNKDFNSLLGTDRQQNLNVVGDNSTTTGGENNSGSIVGGNTQTQNTGGQATQNNAGEGNTQNGGVTTGGIKGPAPIAPRSVALPGPGDNTSQTYNNDNTLSTTIKPELAPPNPITTSDEPPKICQAAEDTELEYTDAEKDELADLLRQYYLIAPNLKTARDVALIENDIYTNQTLIDHADTLTGQCKEEKADPKYQGPQQIKNNPYYADFSVTPQFYAPKEYNQMEDSLNIW